MSYKFKNFKQYIPAIATAVLFSNTANADQTNKAMPLHQTADIINQQISNFDNYWNSLLHESSGTKSRFVTQDKQYIIIMEVPGFDKNQIKVKVNNNKLFIKGSIGEKNKDDDANNYMHKNFNYVISLYDDVDQKNISSNLKNGILTITLPRIEIKEENAREIPIN